MSWGVTYQNILVRNATHPVKTQNNLSSVKTLFFVEKVPKLLCGTVRSSTRKYWNQIEPDPLPLLLLPCQAPQNTVTLCCPCLFPPLCPFPFPFSTFHDSFSLKSRIFAAYFPATLSIFQLLSAAPTTSFAKSKKRSLKSNQRWYCALTRDYRRRRNETKNEKIR